jgi:hypothetical protein
MEKEVEDKTNRMFYRFFICSKREELKKFGGGVVG